MNSWTPDIYHVMNRRRVTLKCKLHLYYVPFVQSKVASRPVARVFLKGGSKIKGGAKHRRKYLLINYS